MAPSGTACSAREAPPPPLHQAVIDEGFIECVQGLPAGGKLFPDISKDVFGRYSGTAVKKMGRFMRSRGGSLKDARVAPAHPFRHQLKGLCRAAGIPRMSTMQLTGHTAGDVGSTYGLGYLLRSLREAVDRLPEVDLG